MATKPKIRSGNETNNGGVWTMERKTKEYWMVERACNGTGIPMTTQAALNRLRKILEELGEHRPLHRRASKLQHEIIMGGRSDAA